MQIYQCPNCGRTYTEFQNVYYCSNCNYRLVKQENIEKIKSPELSERKYNVIGTVKSPAEKQVTCSYCGSTNVSRIALISRMISVEFWGLASNKLGKQWHCHDCGSNF